MLPEHEKELETIVQPLEDKLCLNVSQIEKVIKSADRGARASIVKSGTTSYSLDAISVAVLEELRAIVKKMVERWEQGDDIESILRGAEMGDK